MKARKDRKKNAGAKDKKSRKILKDSCALAANVLTAVLKFVAGAATMSVTVVVSGFYTLCMTAAKAVCTSRGNGKKSNVYSVTALFLGLAALFYALISVKAFFVPPSFSFGLIPAIAVAAAAFYETGSAVVGTIRAAKAKDGVRLTLKRIHFSAAVAALALTQTALLAVNSDTQNVFANASMGIIASLVTAASAADTFARGRKEKKREKAKESSTANESSDDNREIRAFGETTND